MQELMVFFTSYSQIIIPVSIVVLLTILYGTPVIGMVTFLNKKAVPLLLKHHKTKKDIKELVWMTVIADAILIFLFTVVTYWVMKVFSL